MRILPAVLLCLLFYASVTASPLIPTIANPGFEEVVPGNDAPGWGSYSRARASFHSSTENPHSGKRCIVFQDDSPLEPEVYLRFYQGVGVLPGTRYELSVWVRGKQVGTGQHFTDWSTYTLNLPSGDFDWTRVSTEFTTKSGQSGLNLGINVVNLCKELAIDDISLRPVGAALKGKGIDGTVLVPGQVQGDNVTAHLAVIADSSLDENATIEAIVRIGGRAVLDKTETVKPGENTFDWEWNSSTDATRKVECVVRVLDAQGKVIASATPVVEKLSPMVVSAEIDRIAARLPGLDSLIARCRARKIPVDYPVAARTMLGQFIPLARKDVKDNDLWRADFAVTDFNRSLDRAVSELQAYLRDPKLAPNARRYQTGRVKIDGVSFIGERKDTKGKVTRGPVFFCGYGHFTQVRTDMPRWPAYGVNIIQIEVGPSATFPKEDEVSLKAAQDVARVLDRAAERNVMVNVLLSPHYFPAWAMEKWPHLGEGGGGFFGYCVDAPEAKQVLERFLRTVVPLLKDKPALHSFCLSNEPIFDRTAGCDNTKDMWVEYLTSIHGDVNTMNSRYGTKYASFADVPIPGGGTYDEPQFYDYCVFNNERFSGFHKWMADVIHEMAPNVPVHAKIMDSLVLARHTVHWGVDPELFGAVSQINGNDCYAFPSGETISWGTQNMAYDLQRSLNWKPVFNSENHLSPDGSTFYIKPQHFRTALWQGAIHGQGATTIWVWERAKHPGEKGYEYTACFLGNVMDRPGCAEEVGRTCLDLNRFADEVTALQNAPAPAAILWSTTSLIRDNGFLDAMSRAYSALNFCGIRVAFISEKQLAAGDGARYRMIVLPNAVHVSRPAYEALLKLRSRLVFIGDAPRYDPYGKELGESLLQGTESDLVFPAGADPKDLWQSLRAELKAIGALPEVTVVDRSTGEPVWGIEWLPVQVDGRTVINMVNLLETPVEVKIMRQGREVRARDLLSVGGRESVHALKPITPVLAEIQSIGLSSPP